MSNPSAPDTLTRRGLIKILRCEFGNASTARDVVTSFFDEASKCLEEDGLLKLHNFGRFETSRKRERMGRNPRNGVEIKISARTVIKFRPSNKLRVAVRRAGPHDRADD